MRKKWLFIAGAVVLLLAFTTAAFADKPVELVVNGWIVETDVAPQLINDRVMVPVRRVAEALGAKVIWKEETNSVWIDMPESASLQRQIELLQEAVAPATPREAVEKWAKGLMERNGALQYAVLSPELKEQNLYRYKSCRWVTGTSSPWIEQSWYISQIYSDDGLTEQLKKPVEDFLAKQFELHRVLEREVTLLSQSIANSQVEAEFKTKVTHVLGCETPAEWPPQKGRIKYLEENREKLSPEKIQKIEEKIDIWNKQLQEYIDNPNEANGSFKITAELDGMGLIKDDTVKIYYEDPVGEYLPVKEEDWFKPAEELINQGYAEMRELVEQ